MSKPLLPPMAPMTEEDVARATTENCGRRRKPQWRRSIIEFTVFFALIISVFVANYFLLPSSFDSSQWKAAANYEELPLRNRMSANLITSRRLMGLNRFQVIQLLGKPQHNKLQDWKTDNLWDMAFSLSRLKMLVIKFNSQKRVSEVGILDLSIPG